MWGAKAFNYLLSIRKYAPRDRSPANVWPKMYSDSIYRTQAAPFISFTVQDTWVIHTYIQVRPSNLDGWLQVNDVDRGFDEFVLLYLMFVIYETALSKVHSHHDICH